MVADCRGHRRTLLPVQDINLILKAYGTNNPDIQNIQSDWQAMPVIAARFALPLVLLGQAVVRRYHTWKIFEILNMTCFLEYFGYRTKTATARTFTVMT